MKSLFFLCLFTFLTAIPAAAFPDGCREVNCSQCHSLSVQEAGVLLSGGVDRVLNVEEAEIRGFWLVEAEKDRQKFPLFVDFSKSYVFSGNIIRLQDRQNVTAERQARLNRVDVARIPLGDALLLGNRDARTKVIVFTDPECPFCKRLHDELKEVVRRNPEIAFWIKLFPLKIHPNAYTISKSIVCTKSMTMLEDSFEGKPVPPPVCETAAVDETIALVGSLGINSTPTLVLPDGRILPGYRKAEDLLQILSPQRQGR
jgi:thiol:disulfide interchange protein DsbC